MKCEYCLAPISLEDEVCPHCGHANTAAKRHLEDMKKYQKDYNETKEEVIKVTGTYKSITARIIILVVVIIILAASIFLYAGTYSMATYIHQRQAIKHAHEYTGVMDDYLENGRFLDFKYFVEGKGMSSYRLRDSKEYRWYIPVMNVVDYYESFYNSLMSLYLSNDKENVSSAKYIADNLGYEYGAMKRESNSEYGDISTYETVFNEIREQTEALLVRYLNLTREEAESLYDMSDAKRASLIEDKIEALIESSKEGKEEEAK